MIQVRAQLHQDAHATVRQSRELAAAQQFSIRDRAIHLFSRTEFIGTAQQVADRIDAFVQADGSDGFILGSHLTPTGLDEFVDRVVPLLQERGSLRSDYTGGTLRENLGIATASPAHQPAKPPGSTVSRFSIDRGAGREPGNSPHLQRRTGREDSDPLGGQSRR